MRSITLLDVALARGLRETQGGSAGYSQAEVEACCVPFMGGCQSCHATVACYDACPSRTGYVMCASGCIGNLGFPSVEAYDAWAAYDAAMAEALVAEELRRGQEEIAREEES